MAQHQLTGINRVAKAFNLRCIAMTTTNKQTRYVFQELEGTYSFPDCVFTTHTSVAVLSSEYPIVCRIMRQNIDRHTVCNTPPAQL